MTTAVESGHGPTLTHRLPVGSPRMRARVGGAFYLLSFVSIPTLALYDNVKTNADFIVSSGSDTPILWGCFLEVVVALACIGTAVALFPIVKRQGEARALGFVTTRTIEAGLIFLGVVSLLSLVVLHQDLGTASGADSASLVTTGAVQVAIYKWTFLLGQTLMPVLNAVLLGSLLYQSRLVPRIIPTIGLIGAPILLISTVATLFGLNEQLSTWSALAALPIAIWELSLGIWLVVKGFRPSPITEGLPA